MPVHRINSGGSGLSCCWALGQLTKTTAHTCRQTHTQTYTYAYAQPPTSQSEILNKSHIWANKIPKHSINKSKIEAPHLSGLPWEKEIVYFSGILCIISFSFILLLTWAMHFQVKENTWFELHLMHHEGILCALAPTDNIETVKWTFPVCIFPLHTDLPLYFCFWCMLLLFCKCLPQHIVHLLYSNNHTSLLLPTHHQPHETKPRQWR